MAIKANLGTGPIVLSETQINQIYIMPSSVDRYHVTALNVYNASQDTQCRVRVIVSPDLTTANGRQIGEILVIDPESDMDLNAIAGQGFPNELNDPKYKNILATTDIPGPILYMSYTKYTEGN